MSRSGFTVYRIGRGRGVDIHINDHSVSRLHAELIATRGGAYFLIDCASSGGSFVARNGQWMRIRQEFIGSTEAILLGRYQSTAPALIARAGQPMPRSGKGSPLPEGPVRRNADTGEIIGEEN